MNPVFLRKLNKKDEQENKNRTCCATGYRLAVNNNNQLKVDTSAWQVYMSMVLQRSPILAAKQLKQLFIKNYRNV